jgi:hypothetical protein
MVDNHTIAKRTGMDLLMACSKRFSAVPYPLALTVCQSQEDASNAPDESQKTVPKYLAVDGVDSWVSRAVSAP